MSGDTPLGQVVETLDRAGIGHMIVGSFASTLYGPPRTTQDIDLVVDIATESLHRFLELVDHNRFYIPEDSAKQAVLDAGQFNVIDLDSTWKLDLMALGDDPFSATQFARRQPAVIDGAEVYVASAEDTVLAKLRWHRLGGSDRQLRDVSGVLEVMAGHLDETYLDHWANELGVRDLLDGLRAGTDERAR
jgi:hypothetical protein